MTVTVDPRRVAMWSALADQFLDTETRADIPRAALACLDAGYTVDQARAVWRYQVAPLVAGNLWNPAGGAWAGFDPTAIAEGIRARQSRGGEPGLGAALLYVVSAGVLEPIWRAIAGCMRDLAALPPDQRAARASDLGLLAGHYVDFAFSHRPVAAERAAMLSALYAEVVVPIFRPLATWWGPDSHAASDRRVRAFLGGGGQDLSARPAASPRSPRGPR